MDIDRAVKDTGDGRRLSAPKTLACLCLFGVSGLTAIEDRAIRDGSACLLGAREYNSLVRIHRTTLLVLRSYLETR